MGDCCVCCARPKTSVALSVITVIVFVAFVLLADMGPTELESCECNWPVCCVEDDDTCLSDQCACTNLNTGHFFCQSRDETLEGPALVVAWVLLVAGIVLLVVSFASCCCFGCLKKDRGLSNQTTHVGIPVSALAPSAPALEKCGHGNLVAGGCVQMATA